MSIHLHSKAHVHELTTTFCDNRPLYPVVPCCAVSIFLRLSLANTEVAAFTPVGRG